MNCAAVLMTVLYTTAGPLNPVTVSHDETRFVKPGQCEKAIAGWKQSKTQPGWVTWKFVKRREQPHLYLKRCYPCPKSEMMWALDKIDLLVYQLPMPAKPRIVGGPVFDLQKCLDDPTPKHCNVFGD